VKTAVDNDVLSAFVSDCQIDHEPMSVDTALDAAGIMRGYAATKDRAIGWRRTC
jgi:hypothetical protein